MGGTPSTTGPATAGPAHPGPARPGCAREPRANPGDTLLNATTGTATRFLAAIVTATVLTSSFSVPAAAATAAPTSLAPDDVRLVHTILTLPAPQQGLYPARAADRAARTHRAADAAVKAAAATPVTPVVKPAVKPAVKKKPPAAKAPTAKKPVVKPAVHKPAVKAPVIVPAAASSRVETVVRFALAQVGKPYRWGAAGPGAYDCSGLTMAAFARVGIRLAHQSGAQASAGRSVSRSQVQRGDLIVYSGHVAIALGGGKMVHAANPRTGIAVANIYGSPSFRRLL